MRVLIATGALMLAMQSSPVTAQGNDENGAALLARSGCGACHGTDGRGTPLAPGIADQTLALQRFTAAVREPRGTMPPYGPEALSDADIAAIRAHLVSQGPRRQPSGDAQAGGIHFESVGCYSCHSNQGQGVLHGPRIAPNPIRWERFTWYVRQPPGQMPPYSEVVLSESELADIYEFLQARPQPPSWNEVPLLAP